MTLAADAPPPAGRQHLQAALFLVALIELLLSFSDAAAVFAEPSAIAGSPAARLLVLATVALAPIAAAAALWWAARKAIARAILAVAGLVLLKWLSFAPSAFADIPELFGLGFAELHALMQMVGFPLLALAAILLARGGRLGLATLCAITPTVVNFLGVVAFAIGIAIYGF